MKMQFSLTYAKVKNMIDGNEMLKGPYVFITFPDRLYRTWQIEESGDISPVEIRGLFSVKENTDALINILDPSGSHSEIYDLVIHIINEGVINGIALVENKEKHEKRILVIAKNAQEKSERTRQDGQALQELYKTLGQSQILKIPQVYGIFELKDAYVDPLTVLVNEHLDGFSEVSCTATPDGKSMFVINTVVDLQPPVTPPNLENATQDIARSLTMVYKALGNRIPKLFSINSGDFVAKRGENGITEWGLITVRGGPSDTMTLSQFIKRLLLHTESGFDTRIGKQTRSVSPFSERIDQTLQGIAEGLTQTQNNYEEEYKTALKELVQDDGIPNLIRQAIQEKIQ